MNFFRKYGLKQTAGHIARRGRPCAPDLDRREPRRPWPGTRALWILTLGQVLLGASAASGQALDPMVDGAEGLGLGGAYAATAHDPLALCVNPAGLARGGLRATLEVGLGTIDTTVERRSPVLNQPFARERDQGGVEPAIGLGLSYPVWADRLWLGLGYRLTSAHRSRFPATYPEPGKPTLRTDAARYQGTLLSLDQHLLALGLAGSWRWLRAGAALVLGHLRLVEERHLWSGTKTDGANRMEDPALDVIARFQARGTLGASGILGLQAEPLDWLGFGLAVHLPLSQRLDGEVALEAGPGIPSGATSVQATGGDITVDFVLPLRLRAGLFVGRPWLRAHLDLALERWSNTDDPAAECSGCALTLETSASIDSRPVDRLPLGLRLRDRVSIHGGLGSEFMPGLLGVRVGYAFVMGASDPEAPNALLPDLDRHVLSLGLHLTGGPLEGRLSLAQSLPSTLESDGRSGLLVNLLDEAVTQTISAGRTTTRNTRLLLQISLSF